MDLLLERLSSGQIVAVISVVCGCVVGITMIVAIAKYQFQALADDTALKRDKQLAELAMKQKLFERGLVDGASLDKLLTPEGGVLGDEDAVHLNAELAKRFGALVLEDEGRLEETLTLAMMTDNARKASIVGVMDELIANSAPHTAILAAVRPLCVPSAKATAASACC